MTRLDNADAIAGLIRPGEYVVIGQSCAEPRALSQALMRYGRDISVFLGACFSDSFPADAHGGIRFSSYAAIGLSHLTAANRLDILPIHYGSVSPHFAAREGVDVVLLQLAETPNGYHLGIAHDYVLDAARKAKRVIAQINPLMPAIAGGDLPRNLRIDHWIEAATPLPEYRSNPPGEIEAQIASHVAGLIPDGATLETGIGAIPDAVLAALAHHRHLNVHSGMIGDGMIPLIESGVIDNSTKPFDRGQSAFGLLMGTQRLFAFARDNPSLKLVPTSHSHAFQIIARIPRFHAVNSAIEIDLSGQINAETANGRYIGAIGGQNDFVRGAMASAGGKSIIALPSTAKGGKVSRIVARLDGPVTCPRADADYVVTEWGVAALRGKTLRERAKALAAIAHPAFRDTLAANPSG